MLESLVASFRPWQFKGKARLLESLVPRSGQRVAMVHGYRMELDLADHIQRMIFLGAFERWETKVFRRRLRPGMCCVDVGANVGYFSLLAARRVGPTGRVFAVEPSPYAADRLSQTITENGLTNVGLERCGLGRRPSEVVLYDPIPGNHTPTMLGEPGSAGLVVPVRTLDDCASEWGIDRIDLLKVDVEGYEADVFAGAERMFSEGRVGAILCEFNAHWLARAGTTSREVYRELLGRGFVDRSGMTGEPAEIGFENRLFIGGCPGV